MPSLVDLPSELILKISQYLPWKNAVTWSLVNRRLYDLLNYTRYAPNADILAAAVRDQKDPATIKQLFRQITSTSDLDMWGILFVAWKFRDTEALQVLYSEDCFNIHQGKPPKRCAQIFFDAVFQGHELALEQFIELWPNSLGSALVGAAAGGSIATARYLIEHGADVNATGPEDAFYPSCKWFETCEELELAAAEIGTPLGYGWFRKCHEEEVAEDDRPRLSPLACAAAKGHLEMVQLLVQHGAVVEIRDEMGNTPLCWAARQGKHEVVSYILSIYSAEDIQGPALQAFAVAGIQDQSEIVILLLNVLSPKPEPNPDNAKWLIRAATACQRITLLQELCEKGYHDIYQIHPPPLENSAFSTAIEKHNIGMFQLLLEQLTYGHQIMPDLLRKAIQEKDETIVSYLLQRVNAAELHPMILAHATCSEPIFQKLLNAGVSRAALPGLTEDFIVDGRVHVVGALLSDPDFQLEEHIESSILECASFGGKRMFEFLLEQHRWDDQLSPHGPNAEIAIRLAIATGDLDLLQTLLELGFPYTSKHELLLLAASNIRDRSAPGQIIDFLLGEDRRELCELNSNGRSVLFELMSVNTTEGCLDHRTAVRLLLDRGADPLQQNLDGDTPLEEAARKGYRYQSFWLMCHYLRQRDDWHVTRPHVDQLNKAMKENLRRLIKDIGRDRS